MGWRDKVTPAEQQTTDWRDKVTPVAVAARAAPLRRPNTAPVETTIRIPSVGDQLVQAAHLEGRAPSQQLTSALPMGPVQQNIHADGAGNVGQRVMQAGKTLGAGLLRTVAPVLPQDLSAAAGDRASAMESYANAPIVGDVGLEDVNGAGSLARFVGQQLPGSLATMAGLANPLGLATYFASLTGQLGQRRAVSDGRDAAGLGDIAIAAPFAAASTALDRFGAEKILEPLGKTALTRIGSAFAGEGLTEGAQSGIEYAGGTLGTDQGFNAGDFGQQVLGGALAGSVMGAGLRGGVEAGHAAIAQPAAPAPAEIAPPPVEPTSWRELVTEQPIPPQRAPAPAPPVEPRPPVAVASTATPDGPGQTTPEPVAQKPQSPEPPAPVVSQPPQTGTAPSEPAPVEPKAEPAPLRPEPGEAAEGERIVRTPAGASVRTRMEVVDASTLKQAEGANQNRDRSRETTDLQVQDIVSRFDPEQLHEDPSSDRGAPIVGADNAVDSGNGRVLALNKIYDAHPEQAVRYRAMIEGRGFKTEGLERPVLIQRRVTDFTPEQRRQFVIDSNKDTKLELSPVERARGDADSITPEVLAKYAGGDLNSTANAPFVQAFNARLTTGEMGNMIGADRRLTTAGAQRIENAVVASAYGKPKLLERMMESTHDDIRSITGSLADVAAPWAKLRQAAKAGEVDAKYDITDDLADAAARVSDARKSGTKPHDIIAQQDAFDQLSPVAAELVRAFHNAAMTRAASRKAVSAFLADYVKAANAEKAGDGLFGEQPAREPAAILKDLLEARDNPQGAGLALADKAEPAERQKLEPIAVVRDGYMVNDQGTGPRTFPDQRSAAKFLASSGRAGGFDIATNPDGSGFVLKQRKRAAHAAEAEEARQRRRAERSALDEPVEDEPDYAADRNSPAADAGPYDPEFATASFTNRASIFNGAAEAIGMDPDKFTLLPAPRQVALLVRAIKVKFGVDIIVDRGMQERFAIDQMLDAFQNLQGMAHVLDLPVTAISLGDKLKLKLQKKSKYLGAFFPGTNLIALPQRSNSFAHEWGHALDWHLLGMTDTTGEERGRGLTGVVRTAGAALEPGSLPANVRQAFTGLLNAMFFDRAGVARKIMELEAKIAQTQSAKVKAASQLAIDKLKGGNSQVRDIRTAFYNNAKTFDGPAGDYWQSPTEMFARAFEAFVSYKVEAAGLTTEFIGKGDAQYLSNADERFAKTFPKGEERAAVFAAFEQVFGHISDEELLASGPAAAKPEGSTRSLIDYDRTPAVKRERGIIRRELDAIAAQSRQAAKEAADRADSPKGKLEVVRDIQGSVFMSMTGNLRMIQARSNSRSLQKLIDMLTKQDGRGDRTVSRTFAEDVHLQSKASVNRLGNILKANHIALEGRSAHEDMILRDLLTGSLEPDGAPADFVKAAAAIRHLLDNEFYVNKQAGIDLGYTRNGYLARVLDQPKVYADQNGFVRQAAKVYDIVFAKEFGDDMDALLADEDKFPRFLKLASFLTKQGYPITGFAELRAALKALNGAARAASSAKKAGEDSDPHDAKVKQLTADVAELLADMYDDVQAGYSKERAEAWLAKINLVAGEEHNAASPDSKYTKHRELPPEADKIMEKFFLSDPVESVTNYLVTSARRTAYARRFGTDGKKRLALFEGMAAEGVSPDDQRSAERILDTATGRVRSELPRSVQSGLAALNAAGTMALLPRATISSLAEPFTAGLVTGKAMDGFKLLGMIVGGALGSPSGKTRFELARAMGIVSDVASDDIMMARYGQTYADATRWDRYTAAMFTATGLTALTRAQKTHAVGLGHAFLDNLSNTMLDENAAPAAKANALALLRELGVRDPEAFAREIASTGRMPALEQLDSEFGKDYATAQLRFSTMVIQEPSAMDRPELSQNPVGRVVYGITGFSYGYWRNVVKRNGILIAQMAKRDPARAALYASGLFASAAVAYLLGTTVSVIREKLLNPERWKELNDKGQLESQMLQLGFTRTFSFGAADVAIQTWSGLKYQRDASNAFVGAGPGFFLQNAQKIVKPMIANSRKTNTAEYNAVQGIYSNLSPLLAFGIARIPGGPIVTAAKGLGMAYVTSPNARDLVASAAVGTKQVKPKDRAPTRLDKFLDEVKGPVGKDKKASAFTY